MILLQNLIQESKEFIDDYYRVAEEMQYEWDKGQRYQSWRLVPAKLLKLTWLTFVKYGRVNEKALDKIWEIVSENIVKIGINSNIRNGSDVTLFHKDSYDEVTEEEWKRFFNFISDRSGPKTWGRGGDMDVEDGHARYSDGSSRLFRMADKVDSAQTPEEKLLAIDAILNFVHGIGGMAGWFVEGGWESLEDLSNAPVKGIHLTGQLREELSDNKTFIVVDVQPEYQKFISFIPDLVEYINSNYNEMNQLVFLFNGHDTLGMVSEMDYKYWWIENGLDETIVDQAKFYDKGYAFFRYCMDTGNASESAIANFVRFMYENDIRDSRDMTRPMWAKYLREYRRTDRKEVFELLHHSDDCVHIPDLMDFLRPFNNILLCGGGVNECLKEVEIALLALKKPYDVDSQFTY